MSDRPVVILREDTTRERGAGARSNNIMAAKAIADALRSTLGPKGMDKMMIDTTGDVIITNDGATILRKMDLAHPAAKMLVEVALSQEREVGDGTKTAVIIAGELLVRAEELVADVHPTRLVKGYRMAANRAREILGRQARRIALDDETTLRVVAGTAMASKSAAPHANLLADIALRATRAIARPGVEGGSVAIDIKNVSFIKRTGGEISDSTLVDGVVIERTRLQERMPQRVENARVAVIEDAIESKKLERGATVKIRDPQKLAAFAAEETRLLHEKVQRVIASGATVVFGQKAIAPEAADELQRAGIYAVERVSEKEAQAVARATGARAAETLDISPEELGSAGLVEERHFAGSGLTFVTGCPEARSVSILLRGGTEEVLGEVERTLEDALCVLRDVVREGHALPGAGAPEIEVALGLREYAASVGGREQLAIEQFAQAVECIPHVLAENAGLDAIGILMELRSAHEAGRRSAGINLRTGKVEDAWEAGIVEPLAVKTQAIESAAEVASMILRIDDVIASKRA